ncbi:hypothetical protein Tco_1310517 [Tanacetum coccineum]
MRPPGFNQPNVQNNQNRYQGNFNRQNNQNQVYQAPPYQPPTNQVLPYQPPTNGVLKTDFESYVRANDAVLKNVQNQNQGLQNQMTNVTSLLTSLCTKINEFGNNQHASSSSTLPEQNTVHIQEEAKAITTRKRISSYEGSSHIRSMHSSILLISGCGEGRQRILTTPLTQKVQETNSQTTTKVNQEGYVNCPKTYEFKLPYPERKNVEKRHEKDKVQLQKFWKMFKQLHFNISLADALILMPKYTKMLKDLCANKEKLEELANTPLSENCSAVILKKLPEKLGDSCRFTIPCDFSKLKCQGLADFKGASNQLNSSPVFHSSSPMKTSDSTFKEFTDEFTLPNSFSPGDDVSILKKDFQEDTFRIISNPLFEFDDSFKSSDVNPLFEENDKDVEIKSSSSFTPTLPEESELEAYLEKDSIPPGIDLTLPPTFDFSSSNPTSPTLTGEKDLSNKMSMFFSLIRFEWRMMYRVLIRRKILYLLATYLHKKPKPPQEVQKVEMKDNEVSSEIPINTIVMAIRITFDNPIDFNDHFSKPKDLKKDLTISICDSKPYHRKYFKTTVL